MKKLLPILFCIGLSSSVYAESSENIVIPLMDNAKVFAQFTDDFPAVVNYFIENSEDEVISFYKSIYGEITHQERKRGRLTLHFSKQGKSIRIIISPQNNYQQVDILYQSN